MLKTDLPSLTPFDYGSANCLRTEIWKALEYAQMFPNSATAIRTFLTAAAAMGTQTGPTNSVAPSISGNPYTGSVLTAANGTWAGADSFSYQWNAAGVPINGATAATYTPVAGDAGKVITVSVEAFNEVGATIVTSAATAAVSDAPVNTVLPTITGTAQEGEVLTAHSGTWTGTPAPTFTYAWYADGVVISGQTASTYTAVTGDIGKVISVHVTGTNTAGAATANSADTAAVIAA